VLRLRDIDESPVASAREKADLVSQSEDLWRALQASLREGSKIQLVALGVLHQLFQANMVSEVCLIFFFFFFFFFFFSFRSFFFF
jgi:hypothetical protein